MAQQNLDNFVAGTCDVSDTKEYVIHKIHIDTKPIFDESDPETIWLHRLANSWHVVTKPFVIRERLPFNEGETITQGDLAEAEAILRRERYIANAKVQLKPECEEPDKSDISVTTIDNWSLIPTLSFSRSAGNNRTIIGVREDNLFGWGVRSRVRYNSDEQRSGYQLALASAVHYVRHANAYLTLEDNDDGERYAFVFDKPFFHLGTQSSQYLSLESSKRVEDVYQNDGVRNSLRIDHHHYTGSYGWQLYADDYFTKRLTVGFTSTSSEFEIDASSPSTEVNFLPQDREFNYAWLNYEYIERVINVLQDIYYISQPEDINLGWQLSGTFGVELENTQDNALGYHVAGSINKGYMVGGGLLLYQGQVSAILNTRLKDYIRADAKAEYFYRKTELIGFYSRLSATYTNGNFQDIPVVIDDENGVRGYPLQYQHGENRWSASLETRLYANYNFYRLFEVGFAAFFDIGRASGGFASQRNEDRGTLSSIGVGARIYSNRASTPGVLHIDFSRPLSDGTSIDSWALSLNMRRSF